jgi:hypothetical protein
MCRRWKASIGRASSRTKSFRSGAGGPALAECHSLPISDAYKSADEFSSHPFREHSHETLYFPIRCVYNSVGVMVKAAGK